MTDALPSPIDGAVDQYVLKMLRTRGELRAAQLELSLSKELRGESAFKTIAASLQRLRSGGFIRMTRGGYMLAPGVR